jgi:hypothetical protein
MLSLDFVTRKGNIRRLVYEKAGRLKIESEIERREGKMVESNKKSGNIMLGHRMKKIEFPFT